jgi:Fe2+ transport system protein FeoA
MNDEGVITRRDFLRGTAGLLVTATLGSGTSLEAGTEQTARVVLIRHPDAVASDGSVNSDVIRSMLDEAVKTLLGESEPTRAWQKLFKKSDVVGIKSNSWNRLPTPKELEDAIRRRLLDLGVDGKNISIDDRGVLSNPVFARSTALVNARPLRTHHWSGVGTCLKNYIMFVPDPSAYHDEGCSPLGKIWSLPMVKGKTRLNVLCALTPQFYGRGASFFDKRYVWPYKGLIVGIDPVAVDALGAELLKNKRIAFFGEDRALDVPPIHIAVADKKYHLGVSDLSRIQLVKLGWMDDALL